MAIDSQWSNTVLLLQFSESLLDVKGHTVTPVGGAALSSAHAPTGCTNSLLLDGNNDYLMLSSADFTFGTGDFAIEVPVYKSGDTVSGTANAGILLDIRTAEPSVQILLNVAGSTDVTNPNKVVFYVNGTNRIVSTTAMGASFKQITLARISGVTRLFIDGVQEGGNYTDTNNYTGTDLTIGGRFSAISGDYRAFNGNLGPIRITKGSGRGYSTTFTPPSFPLPRPTIKGLVLDSSAAPVAKVVKAFKRSTMLLAGEAVSSGSTGLYTIYPSDFTEHVVLRFDTSTTPLVDGGSGESALIYDRVIPGG